MASRHLSRSVVLQTLFECDLTGKLTEAGTRAVLERHFSDTESGDTDRDFAAVLLSGVLAKQDELDQVIQKAAPQWPLDKIAPVDRNVLRIGLYELLFGDRSAVPPKVALNESIELAKSFGGDSSGRFVNGVLGAVYRSIGEPGKETVKTTSPLPHESLGGALLAHVSKDGVEVALVHDAFGRWTLPKTKCEPGELSDSAARRALQDELGVTVKELSPLGEHEYIAHEPATGRVARTVGYFLSVVTKKPALVVGEGGGITEAKWISEDALSSMPTYNDLVSIIEHGIAAAKKA